MLTINLRDFPNWLREYRKSQKITQNRLATSAEISVYTISRIERGEYNPTLDTIIKIADALVRHKEAEEIIAHITK